jgi:uncharacterized protein YcbX
VAAGSGAEIRREPIRLAAPPGTLVDVAPIHLLSEATLDRLALLHPRHRPDSRRFRPNLIVGGEDEGGGFPELGWLGRELTVGSEVRGRVIDPCPRCVVTTLPQPGVPADPGLLRALARHTRAASVTLAPGTEFAAVVGVYLAISSGGTVRVGSPVVVERPD